MNGTDKTRYQCRLCESHKCEGRIDMMRHIQQDHSIRERTDALMKNIENTELTAEVRL